jgi:hypothetical protein
MKSLHRIIVPLCNKIWKLEYIHHLIRLINIKMFAFKVNCTSSESTTFHLKQQIYGFTRNNMVKFLVFHVFLRRRWFMKLRLERLWCKTINCLDVAQYQQFFNFAAFFLFDRVSHLIN